MLKLITSDIYDIKTGKKIKTEENEEKEVPLKNKVPTSLTIDWKKSKVYPVDGTEIKILAVDITGIDNYMLSLIPSSEPYHGGLKVINTELMVRFQLDEVGKSFSKATANIPISKVETYIKTKLVKDLENIFKGIGLVVKVDQKIPADLEKKISQIQKTKAISNVIAVLKALAITPNTSTLQNISKSIIGKFFPDLAVPEFKIVKTTSNWLGRTTVQYKDNELTTTIEVQKSIVNDEKTLHRVLTHELIHCYLDTKNIQKELEYKKHHVKQDPHGEEFKEQAKKINAVYGEDYVTTTSNLSYVVEDDKEFYIIIQPHKDSFGISKSSRPSKEQKLEIASRIANEKAHVFKTKDKTFSNAVDVKKFGGFSIYKDEEMLNKISEIYNSKNMDHLFKG